MLIFVTDKCIVSLAHCFIVHVDADQGRSALDLAKEWGRTEIMALIKSHVASASTGSEERKSNVSPGPSSEATVAALQQRLS